ncbi:5-methyltetrahydropteroyltriglutamate--homocysteine S-methyltransferase [Oligoflexus tunisiensis]|uniref:5-methyltetrahydropteroyltriglutamate-- homocysteine S-methyltransferase n=1 Tax=Oligoflexus tunisiensis TaxID=708132 RepID=UPI000AA8AF06|nr:5-methyltetrahydropteroyltriglutamate--homocysteine S-methyltransferase [Oligoflexus tunisiensis]
MTVAASNLGFPRIGLARELKKALEGYWAGRSTAEDLQKDALSLRKRHWLIMKEAGIHFIPSNDFSLYDHILDAAELFGVIPKRYQEITDPLSRYFAMARGLQDAAVGIDLQALEMTKWFDTNYHYIVPELERQQTFTLSPEKILREIEEARALGLEVRPVIPGPVTFLKLSKWAGSQETGDSTLKLLTALLPCYRQLLGLLEQQGVSWIQLDEPCLTLDLDELERAAYRQAFAFLSGDQARPRIVLTTYFGGLGDNLALALESGFEALHLDLVRAPEQLDSVLKEIGSKMILSLGVVDGRNIWRTDLDRAHRLIRRAVTQLGTDRVIIAPSCALLHSPVDLSRETSLDPIIRSWLAFSTQKLHEIKALADAATENFPQNEFFVEARHAVATRARSPLTCRPEVQTRLRELTPAMLQREPFVVRNRQQKQRLGLPLLPTTTIGSFPQTGDVRGARAAWRAGRMSEADYQEFLEKETQNCVARQEQLGLDVLVHGEFERNDMVEYFGEQMEGFAFTENGWVQSYGSRCVKPPVLYGDVRRTGPMTVAWSRYAQSLTTRPMKGMLTGPVTILQWSFVRDDQPRSATCMQLALALRDELVDLEAAGIPIIQVDEPAVREGLPLRRGERSAYLQWAVDAFRLATSGVRCETQIHTHMCYAQFGDILEAIAAMDADVISIETSRSHMELLQDFGHFQYPNEVGPGVYDIHSPRVPTQEEMEELLQRAAEVLPVARLWVNPDCGLKTRGWPEVEAALARMVAAAKRTRERLTETSGYRRQDDSSQPLSQNAST